MAEKKVSVRFTAQGGQQVKTEMQGLGAAGQQAFAQIDQGQKSASASAAVFEAAIEAQDRAFDQLRQSLDPAHAATRRYEAAVEQATQAVRMGVATQEEANRVIAMARGRMDTFGGVVVAGGRNMNALRFQVQNAAYQIGDFAVQVGAGQSAMIALGQQAPQFLGAFGLVGAIMGTIAAVSIPLVAAGMRALGKDVDTAANSIDALEQALSSLDAANQAFTSEGLQDIIDKYGELNAEIALLIERQREFAADSAVLAARDAAASLRTELGGVLDELAIFENAQRFMANEVEGSLNFGVAFGIAQDSIAILQEEFGVTVEEAQALKVAIDEAMSTDDAGVMADAMAVISGLIEDSALSGSELAGELLRAEGTLRQIAALGDGMGGWLGGAISQAAILAGTLWDAAAGAAAAAMLPPPAVAPPSAFPTGGPGTFAPSGLPAAPPPVPPGRPQMRPVNIDFGYTPPSPSGGGSPGSGGGSPVDQGLSPWFDEEQERQILDAVEMLTKAQERYNDTVADGADTVTDLFMSFLDGADAAKKALADLLLEMAKVQFQRAILGLGEGNSFIGAGLSALSGALSPTAPTFAGGGYTGSGARSGGLDGRGGFMAMLHPQETVIDHTRGGRGGGGTVTIRIEEAPGFAARVRTEAQNVAVQVVGSYDSQMPARVNQITSDPRAR